MKFYFVSDDYIARLKQIDTRVCDNYKATRIYVGPVFEAEGVQYLAPLTSPKPHHEQITASDVRYFKMHERKSPDTPLGMIRISNMLPVVEGAFELVDVANQPQHYRRLLEKQIRLITASRKEIEDRALVVYTRVAAARPVELVEACCNFGRLEAFARTHAASYAKERADVIEPMQKEAVSATREPRPLLTLNRDCNPATKPDSDG